MSSYYQIAQKVARQCEIAEGNDRRAAAALKDRKAQVRKSMQPEYAAVSDWINAQIKDLGLCSEVLSGAQQRIDALDAIVAATV
jgi:hypothetical protein